MLRIDWDTVGRIVKRVCDDELDPGRLNDLFDIGIDEVSWKRQHNYLTLVTDHQRGKIVWGTDGAGEKAADRFFEELDPEIAAPLPLHAGPGGEDCEPIVGERAAKLRAISLDMGHGYAASARKQRLERSFASIHITWCSSPTRRWTRSAARTGTSCAAPVTYRRQSASRTPAGACSSGPRS